MLSGRWHLLFGTILGVARGQLTAVDLSDNLKILHWVHIPKAGGTALTKVMKKVVCRINPKIEGTNPCCRKKLCLHSNQCFAAVGGCPLVTAIGRHSSNMALAASIPCCSSDLGLGITASFLYFTFPRAETLLENDSGRESLGLWPLADRAAFLMSTGVPRSTIVSHLQEKKYSAELMGGRTIAQLLAAAAPMVTSTHESELRDRNRRLGYCSSLTRIYRDGDVGRVSEVPANCSRLSMAAIAGGPTKPPPLARVGDLSFTILRHPFARALSANMYKVRPRAKARAFSAC